MGVTSIQDAKVLIATTKVKDRATGLKDLVHILKHNRGKTSLETITNKAYLALCETLFQCIRDERTSYYQAKPQSVKTHAELLRLSANALRHVVNSALRTIKATTVELIIETIIELLPGNDGKFLKYLADDLPKSLRALLEYQPHVERMSQECWDDTVNFCVESLTGIFPEDEGDIAGEVPQDSWGTVTSSRARTPFEINDGPSGPSPREVDSTPRATPRGASFREKRYTDEQIHAAEDMVHCLRSLVGASNAPIVAGADALCSVLITFLRRKTTRGNAAALAAINTILPRIMFSKSQLSEEVIRGILPMFKFYWGDILMRDEIMITLKYTEPQIRRLLAQDHDGSLSVDLEAFIDTVYSDYRRRQESTTHQFLEDDYLCFRKASGVATTSHPLSTPAFSLNTESPRCEGLWAIVATIARISAMLDQRKRRTTNDGASHDEGVAVKRLRVTHHFQEYLRHVSEPRSNAKRAALHVLAFIVQEEQLDEEQIQDLLEKLTSYMSSENSSHASWAMIALAAAALQQSSTGPALKPYWSSVWQSASRAATSLSTCRAACHLMNTMLKLEVVIFATVTVNVQSMLSSVELNGPALLTETSIALMITLVRERARENPTNFDAAAERVLNWFFGKWNPHLWVDKASLHQNAQHCNARDILSLVQLCLDRPFPALKTCTFQTLGPIAQVCLQMETYSEFSNYLFLLKPHEDFMRVAAMSVDTVNSAPSNHVMQLESRVAEFCVAELERTRGRWKEMSQQNSHGITSNMWRLVTNFCIVTTAVGAILRQSGRPRAALETATDKLSDALAKLLMKPQTEQYKMEAVLETCTGSLPDLGSLSKLSSSVFADAGVSTLAVHLRRALVGRQNNKQSFNTEDVDFMDIDDDQGSQLTSGASGYEVGVPRHDAQASGEAAALYVSCSVYMHLITAVIDVPEEDQGNIPEEFVEHLICRSQADLLRSRPLIQALFSSRLRISTADGLKLLERFMEALVDPAAREYNTSEVANCMMVESLVGLTKTWDFSPIDQESQDLMEQTEALYDYYTNDMEEGGVRASPALLTRVADFLHSMLRFYSLSDEPRTPSVRTRLFQLLSRGEVIVKYHIAQNLPDIFEVWALSTHGDILQDVDNHLPGDGKDWEGIAIRLFVLSRLASRWHTLLRQCVYRIFEAAGLVAAAAEHASYCISEVAYAKDVGGPKSLFRLFAPQIIFTWLDRKRGFADIPYTIFAYSSLKELLGEIESEAVAQAIMLGSEKEVSCVAEQLNVKIPELLHRNISKAAAYAISWDTCRGSARNKDLPSNEQLLCKLVGTFDNRQMIHGSKTNGSIGSNIARHITLDQKSFPRALGYMFQTMDHEERIKKSLEKRNASDPGLQALTKMLNNSHSPGDFNVGIEPAFSAFYLPDQIDRLCRRAFGSITNFWNASTYTLVVRMLLDRIRPALGSLYARAMLRKIRIVVALAGPVAYDGYPLQMTLQSLRPFLADILCAQDAIGIIQYLFENGAQYLRDNLSFLTGIGLSTLISLRSFLGSSQEVTTQQSQYIESMDSAKAFHVWLATSLKRYADAVTVGDKSAIKAFKLITMAASQVRLQGNSIRGSEESKLLLEILEDARSGRRLLNNASREVALKLLCEDFQPAPAAVDDVLGSDKEAADYAPFVWDSCRAANVGDGYLRWAARVLGRGFSAFGGVERGTAHSVPWSDQDSGGKNALGRGSREAIVQEIVDLLYSDDRSDVSLAEDALRLILPMLDQIRRDEVDEVVRNIPRHLKEAMKLDLSLPPNVQHPRESLETVAFPPARTESASEWIKNLAIALCSAASEDPVLRALPALLGGIKHVAGKIFPYILHLVLLKEFDGDRQVRQTMSDAAMAWFSECNVSDVPYVRNLHQAILYLRSQPVPKEITRVDRDKWLEIDFLRASQAATMCGMYRTALLFAETYTGTSTMMTTSRRSSILKDPPKMPTKLQLAIYKNLDEPDSFYGVDQGSSLSSAIDRFDYEGDGIKSMLFRGARFGSQMRRSNVLDPTDSRRFISSLIKLNMDSVANALLSTDHLRETGDDALDYTLHTARKLGQWDIKAPEFSQSESSTLFKAFQGLHYATSEAKAQESIDSQLLATMKLLSGRDDSPALNKIRLRTLAALTESDELVRCGRPEHLFDAWDRMKGREGWMQTGEFEDVRQILSCRETLLSVLGSNKPLLESLHTQAGTLRSMEVEALLSTSTICRRHGALQESLTSVTYLSDIVEDCKRLGLDVKASAEYEEANILWEYGEQEKSIRIRQDLIMNGNFDSQDKRISLPVLMAKLGHHLAEARSATPDKIIKEYLQPAIRELKGQTQGTDPGQVFHEFALFCDKQLHSPDAAADRDRAKSIMDRRYQEIQDFKRLIEQEQNKQTRDTYRRSYQKATTWYKLDHAEYERLRRGREELLRQCLENYLLSLQASDEYNNDALRVFSLWLEHSETNLANGAVQAHIDKVPSGKFALLMNQLSSRLQADQSEFQKLLTHLVFRICVEHPYHGMHQIFAMHLKTPNVTREDIMRSKDEAAKSRQRSAGAIAQELAKDKRTSTIWKHLYRANEIYHNLAMFKDDKEQRQGRDIPLDRYPESRALMQQVPKYNVPPATLQIEVRASMDYSDLPRIIRFRSRMSIANGLSAPKIITAQGSDGRDYKQLYKSGNDDLRQDAIMEQVFDQVSRLLKNHTATRLRNLGIRTYKVLPLSTRSGLMEFVQDTTPLHGWLMPAHERYYPYDYKPDRCRKEIGAAQQDTLQKRVMVWNKISENFHPVLRYFFLERFEDPDEWFERRLAYTRSTAAISILGHVLGLGDRHCHNILLDEKSGEVVHIDLGVSFEAGRVLPVPEVVPFRLTRDLVDAMGYTKTEGVFRRCCEFTMDTLREERESIMTLLNVLRYDPLVNWSVTATKARRMQEQQDTNAAQRSATIGPGGTPAPSGVSVDGADVQRGGQAGGGVAGEDKKKDEQAGEAGRALSVVEKKLSTTLSTKATVNELIQSATDERNLAVLYMGWASYA